MACAWDDDEFLRLVELLECLVGEPAAEGLVADDHHDGSGADVFEVAQAAVSHVTEVADGDVATLGVWVVAAAVALDVVVEELGW